MRERKGSGVSSSKKTSHRNALVGLAPHDGRQ